MDLLTMHKIRLVDQNGTELQKFASFYYPNDATQLTANMFLVPEQDQVVRLDHQDVKQFIRGDYIQAVLDTYKEEIAAADPHSLLVIANLTYPECENGVIPLNKPTISYAERRANYNKETTPDGVNKADLDLVDDLHLKYDSSSLKSANQNKMEALLAEYKSRIFSHSDIDFGCTDMIEHSIQLLPGSRPIKQTMRTFPQAMEQEAKKEIEKYLKYGVISRTISEWGSPALLVR
ncbi:MAG: hypothetical protein GY737_32720, partial [Desulfobacteraceae bacterium]|nr:hypothetical protein [Desulfobacteraceae bacterium]